MPDSSSSPSFTEKLMELRHNMRTRVGHILGYAEMLVEDLDQELPSEAIRDLKAIHAAGQHFMALIDEFLGGGKSIFEELDLAEAQHQFRMKANDIAGSAQRLHEEVAKAGRDDVLDDVARIAEAERALVSLIESGLTPEALRDPVTDATETREAEVSAVEAEVPADVVQAEPGAVDRLGEGGEILVVDDDPTNRDLLSRRLARQGYQPMVAESGPAALSHLHDRRADLVLLDLMMPGMDGQETLERMKDDPALRSIPVIMLSAADDVNRVVRCIAAGAEDFIPKPFNPILLKARIGAVLEKHRLRQRFARQLRIFISSPGDVIPERRVVKQVISDLNEEFAGRAFLVPMLWEEEPLLASDTFQAQIHSPIEADIFVGILWTRIGSMLPETLVRPDGTRYESGTAYELEHALAGFEERGKPEILVYRKQGAPTMSLDDRDGVLDRLDQMSRLERYLDNWARGSDDSYMAAFHSFSTLEEFETMVATHLRKLVTAKTDDGSSPSAGNQADPG